MGKFITDTIHKYPDPTQHWAVLVGDYGHELWMVRLRDLRTTYAMEHSLILTGNRTKI